MTTAATGSRQRLGEILLGVVFLLLAVGRVQTEIAGVPIKMGENVENLLPLLILAAYLRGPLPGVPQSRALSLLAPGFFLILCGMTGGLVAQISHDALQDFLRLCGQALCGFLLARWMSGAQALGRWPGLVWMLGHALLLWRTPWADPTNPNLEGPFPHRNFQSAFFLLSLPTLAMAAFGGGKIRFARMVPAVLLAVLELFFVIRFRSRAGLLGYTVAAGVLVHGLFRNEPSRRRILIPALVVATLSATFLVILAPRLATLGQEIGNPYERSRVGIWTAAVDGWRTPANWLRGIGMGDEFDRILVDSPTGNLNYHYRRAHYPHSLYPQWVYWGGIVALIGWLALLGGVAKRSARDHDDWRVSILVAALLGYAALEIFDASIRDPRVSALLWFDMGLLAAFSFRPAPPCPDITPPAGNGKGLPWAQVIPFYLPLAWAPRFSYPEVLGVLTTTLFVWCAGSPFFQDWVRAGHAVSVHAAWRRTVNHIWSLLVAVLLVQLYLPALPKTWLAPIPVLFMGTACLVAGLVQRGRLGGGGIMAAMLSGLGLPLALGVGLWTCLRLSPLNLPEAFLPNQGLMMAAGLTLALWGLWRLLAGRIEPVHTSWGPFGHGGFENRLLVVGGLLVLIVLTQAVGVGVSHWRLRASGEAGTASWERLIRWSKQLGVEALEDSVRASALTSDRVRKDPERWVNLAKDSAESRIPEDKTGQFARFLARGGKALPDNSVEEEPDEAVGLTLDHTRKRFLILTARGRIVTLDEGIRATRLVTEGTPFAHCRLDPNGNLLVLSARGGLHLWNDGETRRLCPEGTEPIFRRLAVDPRSGHPWALDLYGNLYHSPSDAGWIKDERFLPVSEADGIVYDVARDLTLSEDGKVAMLDCYGRVWSASLDSPLVKGPLDATHYWPKKAAGQSLQADSSGFTVVDRFGGVYLTPYPMSPAVLGLRGSHLFPRSLPRRDPDVVDHVYLPDKRWIYLLTKSGRILTNTRWNGVWAN